MSLATRPNPKSSKSKSSERHYLAAAKAASGVVVPHWARFYSEVVNSESAITWLHVARRKTARA